MNRQFNYNPPKIIILQCYIKCRESLLETTRESFNLNNSKRLTLAGNWSRSNLVNCDCFHQLWIISESRTIVSQRIVKSHFLVFHFKVWSKVCLANHRLKSGWFVLNVVGTHLVNYSELLWSSDSQVVSTLTVLLKRDYTVGNWRTHSLSSHWELPSEKRFGRRTDRRLTLLIKVCLEFGLKNSGLKHQLLELTELAELTWLSTVYRSVTVRRLVLDLLPNAYRLDNTETALWLVHWVRSRCNSYFCQCYCTMASTCPHLRLRSPFRKCCWSVIYYHFKPFKSLFNKRTAKQPLLM